MGRENLLGRLQGARRAAFCSHTLMLSSLEPLCLQTLGLGAPSSCSVSGCSLPLSRLVLSPVSCPGLLPAGERDVGWAARLRGLRCARWGCRVAPGSTASTGSAAASRQESPASCRGDTGCSGQTCSGRELGLVSAICLWQAQKWLLQSSAARPPPLNQSVFTGGCWRSWWDLWGTGEMSQHDSTQTRYISDVPHSGDIFLHVDCHYPIGQCCFPGSFVLWIRICTHL